MYREWQSWRRAKNAVLLIGPHSDNKGLVVLGFRVVTL